MTDKKTPRSCLSELLKEEECTFKNTNTETSINSLHKDITKTSTTEIKNNSK